MHILIATNNQDSSMLFYFIFMNTVLRSVHDSYFTCLTMKMKYEKETLG